MKFSKITHIIVFRAHSLNCLKYSTNILLFILLFEIFELFKFYLGLSDKVLNIQHIELETILNFYHKVLKMY